MAMLVTQTVGTIDSKHRLPAPRQFVAISVLWGILFLAADTTMNKLAARLSALILLTGMVLGPFGKVAINFLNWVATSFTPNFTNIFASDTVDPGSDTGDTGATGGQIA